LVKIRQKQAANIRWSDPVQKQAAAQRMRIVWKAAKSALKCKSKTSRDGEPQEEA
jgi:hypothetical protein